MRSRYSSLSIVTRLRAGWPGVDSRQVQEFLLRHYVQSGSEAYTVGNGCSYPRDKAAGV
jgi:hypothetical protein